MRAGFWLQSPTSGLHDASTGILGSHRRIVEAVASCHEVELPVQINTILGRRNLPEADPMIEFLTHLDVVLWNVNFFVPTGNQPQDEVLEAGQFEVVFKKLYSASKRVHFQIKTREGQHYLRYCFQQRCRESRGRMRLADAMRSTAWSARDSRRVVFINHHGEAYPSRFLPVSGGNVMEENRARVYRNSELFVSLGDRSRLKGKCGLCPARDACGGSRARAYAMTGDLFAEDPCCAYQP
jgi:AdoMet-dependent heme synthase